MSEPAGPAAAATEPSSDVERAARLRVMGAVLRDATGDETDDGWGRSSVVTDETSTGDEDLHREVPPHHGG